MRSMAMFLATIFLSSTGLAAGEQRSMGDFQGLVLESTSTMTPFNLVEGTLEDCRVSGNGYQTTRCSISGGNLRFTLNGEDANVPLETYVEFIRGLNNSDRVYKTVYAGQLIEAVHGVLVNSPIRLIVQYTLSDPSNIYGTLEIDKYSLVSKVLVKP